MNTAVKSIIIIAVIALLGGGAYLFLKGKSAPSLALESSSGVSEPSSATASDTEAINQDFLTKLSVLNSIRFDMTVFSDKIFTSLKDFTVTLVSEGNEGRPNPFAPIGTETGSTGLSGGANPNANFELFYNSIPNTPISTSTQSGTQSQQKVLGR